MKPLEKALRRALEATVVKARDIAEAAAREDLQRLTVGDAVAGGYLDDDQRKLRNRLRAHGRQLGDMRKADATQSMEHLVVEIAYEHWHRMLFARFLAENNLLMYEDGVTALSLQDCFDLAKDEGGEGWGYAARYAANMLPQIFRPDSPAFEITFAPNHQQALEKLLMALDAQTFQASDALGWVYQFWQSKKKKQVNDSEVKIGADELPAVTQLFTEPYMVSFLLDNALGAWWAARRLSETDLRTANSEEELRNKASIPGVPLEYLRFVRQENGAWIPAAGTFEKWPEHLSELKMLDPCCGSGHFLVAVFLMLVPMRMEMEGLSAREAVDAVLRENIHGLELDQRCVELAAFALAMTAWKYPNAGGYRNFPKLQLACVGLWVNRKKEDWMALADGSQQLEGALEQLYYLFKQAPALGSLIDPHKVKADLFTVDFNSVENKIQNILNSDRTVESHEVGIAAQGMAKAAGLLARKYHFLITNPPYLGERKQSVELNSFCRKVYPEGRPELAISFVLRDESFVSEYCQCLVIPQNWLYQYSYKAFRNKLLKDKRIRLIAQLGSNAFESSVGADVLLLVLSHGGDSFSGLNLFDYETPREKSRALISDSILTIHVPSVQRDEDVRIVLDERNTDTAMLKKIASSYAGILNGDTPRFVCKFWEQKTNKKIWRFLQSTVAETSNSSGKSDVVFWEEGNGQLRKMAIELKERLHDADRRGNQCWGNKGIAVSQMGSLPVTIYDGSLFDSNVAVIYPKDDTHILPIWTYCSSDQYQNEVRKIDKKRNVTNATLVKVPFDLDLWTKVAKEKYPHGLPNPYTDDPTQWIFHGHPCGSVVWDKEAKWTAHGTLRTDATVLQVAVARLLGYRWPAELDADMELADEQCEWVKRCESLLPLADDDGIVCLSAVRGEQAAVDRLEAMLQAAFGDAWSANVRNALLDAVGCAHKSLDFWLRDKFFEQHCKLFQHRPFIWHVWDGLNDGFSVLLNYHTLDKQGLERLIYTYLDDWIRTQTHGQAEGLDGAGIRLQAAQGLKQRLEQILKGEAPYDIFVRWKSLEQQSIGWNPDINDGVRLNIRPFMTVEDVARRGAGILRFKPNIHWKKDRGKDVASAPWYKLGLEYGGKEGDRINEHHLSLDAKHLSQQEADL